MSRVSRFFGLLTSGTFSEVSQCSVEVEQPQIIPSTASVSIAFPAPACPACDCNPNSQHNSYIEVKGYSEGPSEAHPSQGAFVRDVPAVRVSSIVVISETQADSPTRSAGQRVLLDEAILLADKLNTGP